MNLVYSTDKGFNPDNWSTAANGAMLADVQPPVTITGLQSGIAHYLVAEVVNSDGSRVRAAETSARPNRWLGSGTVNAQTFDAAGRHYLGGTFTHVGVYAGGATALSTSNGQLSAAFPVVDGQVHAFAADGEGGWYVGGVFHRIGGVARQNRAHVLANGDVDARGRPLPTTPSRSCRVR